MHRIRVSALALTVCLIGCGSSGGWQSSYYYSYDPAGSSMHVIEAPDLAPALALPDAEVEATLAAATVACAPALDPALDAAPLTVAAREVAAAYREGDRARARLLIDARDDLLHWSDPGVVVSCRFDGGALELTAIRADTSLAASREPIAVCFEPGTHGETVNPDPGARRERWTGGEQEHRFGHWPPAQDLALLRAPVLVIPRGEALATARVPVACASFNLGAPRHGQPYALSRFPEGSAVDRLMQVLCAGDEVPGDAEAQLAVWLARDDVTWAAFAAEGGDRGRLITFGTGAAVRARHAQGAATLILRAGVDPRPLRFFAPTPRVEPAPPAPEPAPIEGDDIS